MGKVLYAVLYLLKEEKGGLKILCGGVVEIVQNSIFKIGMNSSYTRRIHATQDFPPGFINSLQVFIFATKFAGSGGCGEEFCFHTLVGA